MIMKMGVKYIVDHIPKDTPYNRRPGLLLAPEYITIHSTGNPSSTARNERAWLTNPVNDRTASWHICIDENEAIEAVPLGEVAWHAGDGGNGPGNRKSIAIEICESGNRAKTLENAAALTATFLQERNWKAEQLRRHFDWSGKLCPRILMADNWAGWENFKSEVQKHLDKLSGEDTLQDEATEERNTGEQIVQKYPPGGPQEQTAGSPPDENQKPNPDSPQQPLPQIQRRVEGTLDGRPVDFEAFLINNNTYLPLRPLAEALGLLIGWEEGEYRIYTK